MIELYWKTVKICSIIAAVLLVVAFVMEIYGISSFLENIVLGIFCSLLVVVITVWLQFKHEQQRINREITVQLKQIIDQIRFSRDFADYIPPSPIYEGKLYDDKVKQLREIDKMILTCVNLNVEQSYILKSKEKYKNDVLKALFLAGMPFMEFKNANFIEKIDSCVAALKPGVEAHLKLAEDGYYKEQLEDWIANQTEELCSPVESKF